MLQVCRRWREAILRLRWRRLRQFRTERSVGAADMSDISLLLSSRVPVRLAGLGILLPTGSVSSIIQSHLNPISTNFRLDVVNGEIEIFRNGTDHQGPLGQKIFMKEFHICQEENEIFEYFRLNI